MWGWCLQNDSHQPELLVINSVTAITEPPSLMRGYFRLLQGATSSAPISIIHTPVPPSPWGLSAGSLVVVMQSWAPDSCPTCRRAAPALAAHPDRQVETIHPNRRGCEGITQPQEGAHGSQRQHKALSCARCPHAAPPSRAAPGEGEELKAQRWGQ